MWYVRGVLYAVLYVRVSCFVVRGCGVSRRYIYVCYCDMFSVVNVYLNHLNFYVVCINSRRYVCCSECDVVSNECNEPPTCLFDFIVSQNIDVLALIETLLCCGDNDVLNEVLPSSYAIPHVNRERSGGGLALIYLKNISFRNIVPSNDITQFELLDCIIKVNKLSTRVVVVYRLPQSGKNGLRYENFAI